jgi:hypothetical protein
MTDYSEMAFIDYLNEVDDLLESKYGITSNDCDMDHIAACQECGESPEECVRQMAEDNDLIDIEDSGW